MPRKSETDWNSKGVDTLNMTRSKVSQLYGYQAKMRQTKDLCSAGSDVKSHLRTTPYPCERVFSFNVRTLSKGHIPNMHIPPVEYISS